MAFASDETEEAHSDCIFDAFWIERVGSDLANLGTSLGIRTSCRFNLAAAYGFYLWAAY